MNKATRAAIEKIINALETIGDEVESLHDDEQEKFDNLPAEYSHLYMAASGQLVGVICIADPLQSGHGARQHHGSNRGPESRDRIGGSDMYLKKDGTQVEHLPVLDDYAKDDPNMGVETAYFVELFDENHHLLGRLENGNTYPNESQRRFYLLKHPEAVFIGVKRVYRRVF